MSRGNNQKMWTGETGHTSSPRRKAEGDNSNTNGPGRNNGRSIQQSK